MPTTINESRPIKCPTCGYSPLYRRGDSPLFDCKNPTCRAEFIAEQTAIYRGGLICASDLSRICRGREMTAQELRERNTAAVEASRYSSMVRLEQTAQRLLKTEHEIRCLYSGELPEHCTAADSVLGLTGRSLHLALREHISFLEGASRVIIFNAANIQAHFESVLQGLNQALIHECAHIAVGGFSIAEADERDPADAEARCEFSTLQLGFHPVAAALDQFDQHDAAFWRAVTHLVSRAYEDDLDFDLCGEHERYGLDAKTYYRTLQNEIETFDAEPLIEALRSTEPPQEFVDLFNSDVARIRSSYF